MTVFQWGWSVSLLVLVAFALLLGKLRTAYGWTGILIDNRGRYSLNRFQVVAWTLLILATLLGWFFTTFSTAAFTIPTTLLGLMGISAGSATVAGAVKDNKDAQGQTQRAGQLPAIAQAQTAAFQALPRAQAAPDVIKPHFSQVFLQEEGSQIDQIVDVSKFQNFLFTVALLATYVTLVWQPGTPHYPDFQGNVLWLLGVSHAYYVGGKLPNKS